MDEILNWFNANEDLVQQIGSASLVLLGITIVLLPIVVAKLPADYFISETREPARKTRKNPFLWTLLSLVKNLLGLFLILVGIAMLVLPGQGTVTILIGLAISNFPGKYKLERRIASQPAVGGSLNKIWKYTGATPLLMPTKAVDDPKES